MSREKNTYEICLTGHLDDDWVFWFEGFTITHDFRLDGTPQTRLRGVIPDQSALHGILLKLRDIGIPILSVNRIGLDTGGRE